MFLHVSPKKTPVADKFRTSAICRLFTLLLVSIEILVPFGFYYTILRTYAVIIQNDYFYNYRNQKPECEYKSIKSMYQHLIKLISIFCDMIISK